VDKTGDQAKKGVQRSIAPTSSFNENNGMKQSDLARIESGKGGKTRGDTFARLTSAMSLTVG